MIAQVNSEVEYIKFENLDSIEDADECLKTILSQLSSENWTSVCEALENVCRLSRFHKEAMLVMLTYMDSNFSFGENITNENERALREELWAKVEAAYAIEKHLGEDFLTNWSQLFNF
ncbi:hypothetical protein TorRG33x02_013710 [Trema orientale]|uniref:Uncharacterized protein n=1 Tax=Trema orientale TaxID=63057 RepID=A0A2P5FX95_TREOI|nr:hypothetical protein TorRG33x02_013710 [Trema orientale]